MSNMEDLVDEVLTGKIKPEKIFEKRDSFEDEQKEREDKKKKKQDNREKRTVLETRLKVNDVEQIVSMTETQYKNKALTDFISLCSLFKESDKIDIKKLLVATNLSTATPEQPQVDPGTEEIPEKHDEEEKSDKLKVDSSKEEKSDEKEEKKSDELKVAESKSSRDRRTTARLLSMLTEEEDDDIKLGDDDKEKKFQDLPDEKLDDVKLTSFKLSVTEKVSQASNGRVSIVGEENINGMLSFKVSASGDSTPFNTPEPAISHFNNAFFNNIVKEIDKDIEANG